MLIESVMGGGNPNPSIKDLLNKCILAIDLGVMPSEIEKEENKNIEALILVKNTLEKKQRSKNNG